MIGWKDFRIVVGAIPTPSTIPKGKKNYKKNKGDTFMTVSNFICNTCENMEICKAYSSLKKFSEDDVKVAFPTDITIDDCKNFKQVEEIEE